MPAVNVTSFTQIVETLENMLQGVKNLNTTPGFPPVITEQILNEMLTSVKAKRDAYEQASASAVSLYEEYNSETKTINGELSRFKTMLYGFFGKKNPIVNNFGIRPYKVKARAAKATQSAQNVTKAA